MIDAILIKYMLLAALELLRYRFEQLLKRALTLT